VKNALAIACLLLLGIGLFSATGKQNNTPNALAPIQTPTQTVKQPTPEQLALETKCKGILNKDGAKYWSNYHTDKNGTFVVLKPAFFSLKFEDREIVHQAFRCVVTQGRMDDSVDFISYEDPYTNAQVGSWSPNLGLRFDR
jgi:hypothetical protein